MHGDDAGSLRLAAERARGGSTAAFRELVERTHAAVFRLAFALTGDRDEAADVTQETFVRAFERIDELRDPAAASAWLFRIARNVARDRRGSWWRRITAPLDSAAHERAEAAAPVATPHERLEAAESAGAVQRALRSLPEKHRVVLQLRDVEGMSYEEIALALGVPVGTVESRLHRARARLARRLAPFAREERR